LATKRAENPDKATKAAKTSKRLKIATRANDTGKLTKEEQDGFADQWAELFPGPYADLLDAEVVK